MHILKTDTYLPGVFYHVLNLLEISFPAAELPHQLLGLQLLQSPLTTGPKKLLMIWSVFLAVESMHNKHI